MSASRVPILFGFWRSSAAWRVRTALKIKKIDYEYRRTPGYREHVPSLRRPALIEDAFIAWTRPIGAHKTEEYRAVMPLQLVPALLIPSNSEFNKSNKDMFVKINHPKPIFTVVKSNTPAGDPALKAAARAQALVIAADIQPLGQVRVVEHVEKSLKGNKHEWIQTWISRGFDGLEKMVAETSGKYCVGDEVTVADLCLVPQVFNAKLWGIDMTKYPNLNRIDAALSELEEFKAAHAHAQPDAPTQTL